MSKSNKTGIGAPADKNDPDFAEGGSGGGDDALVLTIAQITRWPLSCAYLLTDLIVLMLSLSYIPWQKIAFSLVTVTLSSWIIDWMQRIKHA